MTKKEARALSRRIQPWRSFVRIGDEYYTLRIHFGPEGPTRYAHHTETEYREIVSIRNGYRFADPG